MESMSRISDILETARDLTLEAAATASSRSSRSAPIPSLPALKKLLDSRSERDVLLGLRHVISLIYRPQSVSTAPLFSSVIKNVASPSLPIRKLVYIYLLHHAESEPDLALLSINTIQKTLSDGNPAVRALALRVMSGIRVPVISQIVSLAIKRGVGDMSPLVRKAAALAIPKCVRLDPGTEGQMVEYLGTLMGDKQYFVAGPAVMAFMEVCPERIDLVHQNYRGLIRKLVDMDEWSQVATLRLMLAYSRRCFPRRTRRVKSTGTKGFYGDEEEEEQEGEEVIDLDSDLKLFLDASKPLLQSRNAAVVIAVARCYIYLGTDSYVELCIGPLIALLRSPHDIQQIALHNIVQICLIHPTLFVDYSRHFLVRSTDPPFIWQLKLELLTLVYTHCDTHMRGIVLSELEHFSRGSDAELVRESVRAIGRCAQNDPKTTNRCLRLLLKQISSPDGNLVAESLTVIRHLIQQDPGSHTKTVIRLAKGLDTATNPQARASIIWLVGEFAGVDGEDNIAPDVLRILVKGFATEDEAAKLQIALLAAKVYVHFLNRIEAANENGKQKSIDSVKVTSDSNRDSHENPETHVDEGYETRSQEDHAIAILWRHVLLLVRYDTSYDLRDRTRLYQALLAVPSSTQLATLMLLAPKPVPHTPSPSESRKAFSLGSTSLIIGDEGGPYGLKGYEPLPEWVQAGSEPDARLREDGGGKVEYGEKRIVPAGERLDSAVKGIENMAIMGTESTDDVATTGKEKTLDDWLAESEDDQDDDESETSGEEESSEEESEEESEEDEQHRLVH